MLIWRFPRHDDLRLSLHLAGLRLDGDVARLLLFVGDDLLGLGDRGLLPPLLLVVGNARHIKNVPGRKTDVKDREWIADLVRHGLIAKSFVPPQPIPVLRDLVRDRRKLVESCSTERNRLLELLETCTIKLASFASNVFGVSGMAMLCALAANASTPT